MTPRQEINRLKKQLAKADDEFKKVEALAFQLQLQLQEANDMSHGCALTESEINLMPDEIPLFMRGY